MVIYRNLKKKKKKARVILPKICLMLFRSVTTGVCGEPDPPRELSTDQLWVRRQCWLNGMRVGKTVFRGRVGMFLATTLKEGGNTRVSQLGEEQQI